MNSMRNLYDQVYNRRNSTPKPSINQAYASLYNEQANISGESEMDSAEENNIVVYYSETPEGQKILKDLMTKHVEYGVIRAASMDQSYFEKKIVGRLDQAMHDTARDLVKRIFAGEEDTVAFKALYDVMAENVISNGTCKKLIGFKTGDVRQDHFMEGIAAAGSEGYDVVDVVKLLANNFKSCYNVDDEVPNPIRVINQLWDVKDVKGRTSVGRGELAMCMFSTAVKGSPGDVVENKLTATTNAGLKTADDTIKIEVKGSGGRPGLGNHAHNFAKSVPDIIKNHRDNVGELSTIDASSMTVQQQQALDFALQSSPKAGTTPEAQIQALTDYLTTEFPESDLDTLLPYLDLNVNVDEQWYADVGTWEKNFMATYFPPTAANKPLAPGPIRLLGVSNHPTTGKPLPPSPGGMKVTIPALLTLRKLMLSSPDVALGKITAFAEACKSLFLHILPLAPGGSDPTLLANLLIATRTEEQMGDEHKTALVSKISELIQDGIIDMTQEFTMAQAVGAMQLTSYCMVDKFTYAMLVDDRVNDYDNSLKSSLVIRTDPGNPAETFALIIEAFIDKGVKVPLSIDKQNKGVQLQFTAS